MNLYVINDDPNNDRWRVDPEDVVWLAIWASTEEEAAAIYRHNYECPDALGPDGLEIRQLDIPATPAKPTPHIEHREEVLRLANFREEGERTCDTCGLASMGLKQFRVCSECGQCPECGHCDDCGEKDDGKEESIGQCY